MPKKLSAKSKLLKKKKKSKNKNAKSNKPKSVKEIVNEEPEILENINDFDLDDNLYIDYHDKPNDDKDNEQDMDNENENENDFDFESFKSQIYRVDGTDYLINIIPRRLK